MARLTRKKCDRNLIEAKVVVKDSGAQVKVAKVVVKVSTDRVKAAKVVVKVSTDRVKVAKVVVKVSGDRDRVVKVAPVPVVVKTHADPAKAIEISLVLNAVTPKAY